MLAASADRQLKAAEQDRAVVQRLASFRSAMLHVLRRELDERPILSDSERLHEYLRADMAFSPVERFRLLCLDVRNRLIRDEVLAQGTVDKAQVYVREVLGRALEVGAASLIVVHNHPSGDLRPSRQDTDLTRRLARLAPELDMSFLDHLIVSSQGVFSFRSAGLIGA